MNCINLWHEWDSKERPDRREGKKVSGGHFFSSGESPKALDCIPEGCWQVPFSVVESDSNHQLQQEMLRQRVPLSILPPKNPPPGILYFYVMMGLEESGPTVGRAKKCPMDTRLTTVEIVGEIMDRPLLSVLFSLQMHPMLSMAYAPGDP